MTAATIHKLSRYLPIPKSPGFGGAPTELSRLDQFIHDDPNPEPDPDGLGGLDAGMWRFVDAYRDLRFGWRMARTMAIEKRIFPVHLARADRWIYKAYLYMVDDRHCFDPHVAGAIAIASPPMRHYRYVINGLLIAENATAYHAAKATGLHPLTIEAYEKLFYNVIDRRIDHLFLAGIVYPHGRVSEYRDKAIDHEGIERLLLRAGYNYGPGDVLYLAGFRQKWATAMSSNEGEQQLKAHIMLNALIMAKNGWLNKGDSAAIGHARALMVAARAAGDDVGEHSPLVAAGASIVDDMKNLATHQMRERQQELYARQVGQ